jgi:hypothetical protein
VRAVVPAAHEEHDAEGHHIEPLEPNVGWSDWLAERSYDIAGLFSGVQNGHMGRYVLVSVLGLAAILLLTLAGSTVGVTQTFTGPR